jgi:eukaryotic-like serine/threonine-protein kinase
LRTKGKEPDTRSDIFAFGEMLHEMATGQRAFVGKSQAGLFAAILSSHPPPISRLKPVAPPALDRVVATCLAKDPDERWQSAHDLQKELKWIQEAYVGGAALPVVAQQVRPGRIAWGALAIAVALAGLAAFLLRDPTRAPPPRTIRATLLPPAKATFSSRDMVPVSPDGRRIAFVAKGEDGKNWLWVRPLDGLAAQALPGTEGATYPFWSADSRALGFFADGKLKRVDASGGPPQVLCDAPFGRGGAWNRDGVIVFAGEAGRGLSRISATGGVLTPVTRLDGSRHETAHRWPSFLPDGRHFLYTALGGGSPATADAVFVGTLGANETTHLVDVRSNASYSPPGYLLFAREGALVAQPLDATRRVLTGHAVRLADQVQFFPPAGNAAFSVSENGVLAYQTGTAGDLSQFVWFDRTGKASETGMPAGPVDSPRLSHDGRRVAFRVEDRGGQGDLWIHDLARRVSSRFTFDPANDFNPFGRPTTCTSGSARAAPESPTSMKRRPTALEPRSCCSHRGFARSPPTGRQTAAHPLPRVRGHHSERHLVPVVSDRKATVVLQTGFFEAWGQLSSDGLWMAYHSYESGR